MSLVNQPSPLALAVPYRGARALLAHVFPYLDAFVVPWGCVARLGPGGEKEALLMDADGAHITSVTAVHQHGRRLYLGSLENEYVSYVDLEEHEL